MSSSGPYVPLADSGAAAAAFCGSMPCEVKTSPWPGSTTPQPKPPSLKRANAIAFVTGSGPLMRVTLPSLRNAVSTFGPITLVGPRM